MRIAYVHSGQFPSKSPSFTFTTMNALGLAAVFDHCYFFIKQNSALSPAEILKHHFDLTLPANLSIIQLKQNSLLNTNYFYFRTVYRHLKELISQKQVDVVISRNITFLPYLKKLKEEFKIPVYFETHDFYANLSAREDVNKNKKKRYEKIERQYIPHLSGVICLQNAQREWYQRIFPQQQFRVARTGLAFVRQHSWEERKFLTYIGSLDLHKGIDVLVKALNITTTRPHLLIIGGKNNREIETISNQLHQIKFTITGWIDKKKLNQYLSRTAAGVIPLKDTFFNRYITSPLKLFDFYSHSIPVIAADLPTNRELIEENKTGVFFEPDNPASLAKQIDNLFTNRNLLKNMSDNIYKTADQYLWENRAKQIYSIINDSIK